MSDHPRPQALQDGAIISAATDEDVLSIKRIVDLAYSKYIDRIGKPPAPMTEDYHEVIRTHNVLVVRDKELTPLGAIIFSLDKESKMIKIKNLVVNPAAQGRGYGRVLMERVEGTARHLGITALELYTNVKMYENVGMYPKMGFLESGRRVEAGFERVYFRKELA
ncbi:acyl-CoA N-acyltransferase [Penicillium argentinense]|uniref:Acyl-CoA N-acyltransferase n=1 Tax=Penicillium argentinense TaxID=1131581 RepID=A0A9W9JUM7_9EURO|nr:acyl-CoA N-acyltransferase [Penicillium argentinense]KAJ5082228.1 acyl-CoA N-acyltransferase [Penicillium argentinense]